MFKKTSTQEKMETEFTLWQLVFKSSKCSKVRVQHNPRILWEL